MSAAEFNHFAECARALEAAASQVIRKTALDIEAAAKENAPVDTGFLKSSIYAKTDTSSDYGTHLEGAGSLLPEIDDAVDANTAYVAVGASYGLFVELGTSHNPARPYLVPAAERVRPSFEAAMQAIETAMRREVGGG